MSNEHSNEYNDDEIRALALRRWREQGKAPAGVCPFCASRISVVERDGVFVARCSHRGCAASGPKHHDLTRACDLFCRHSSQSTAADKATAMLAGVIRERDELRAKLDRVRTIAERQDLIYAADLAAIVGKDGE